MTTTVDRGTEGTDLLSSIGLFYFLVVFGFQRMNFTIDYIITFFFK